jgi:hypothetical protein
MHVKLLPMGTSAADLQSLPKPYLKTSGQIKVSQLKKYISKKLRLDDGVKVELLCRGDPLGGELSLHFVMRTRWVVPNDDELGTDFVLHYRKQSGGRASPA